jgi:hypothetical protein
LWFIQPGRRDADSPGMRHAEPFARVLDEKLAAGEAEARAPFRPAPVFGFFDFSAPPGQAFRPRPTPRCAPPPPPPQPRRLSKRQHQALDDLNTLGASLDITFTADDLRRAFRTLAHRYHPDRHPRTTCDEQARLAAQFRRAHDAYRILQVAVAEAAAAA